MDYICKTYEEYCLNSDKANQNDVLFLAPDVWNRILKNPDDLKIGKCKEFKMLQNDEFLDEIQSLVALELPFDPDEKILNDTDEYGNVLGDPYSYNDFLEKIENISGICKDLC